MARKPGSGSDLIERLNAMVAELIKTNRKLQRELDKLTARRPKAARTTAKKSSRAAPRRVKRVAKKPVAVKRGKTIAVPKSKRKTVAPRRRKTAR
jgi:regulator of replication initiation timing